MTYNTLVGVLSACIFTGHEDSLIQTQYVTIRRIADSATALYTIPCVGNFQGPLFKKLLVADHGYPVLGYPEY